MPTSDPRLAPRALRLIGLAMAGGLTALVAFAVALRPRGRYPLPQEVVWILGGLAAGCLLVGVAIAVTADPAAAGYRTRLLVSLALRETAGLVGAVVTLLGADVAWAIALGGAAVVSLLVLRPRPTGR